MNKIGIVDGELYFYIHRDGRISKARYFRDLTFDCLNRCTGNCFRTEKEAEANRGRIMKILKGENGE